MLKMNLSNTSTTNFLYTTSGTLSFMQESYKELIRDLVYGQVGSSYVNGTPYIVRGCAATVSGGSTTIGAGAIFFEDEMYYCAGGTIATPSGGNVIVFTLQVYNTWMEPDGATSADPALYEDLATHNTYDIRQVTFAGAASGSGMFDFSAVKPIANFISTGIVYGSTGGYTAANVGSPYFNVGYSAALNKVSLCGAVAVSIPAPGTFTLFTLPVGSRPASTVIINPKTDVSTVTGLISIAATGIVSFSASGSATGNFYLDGVTFRLS